MSDDLSIEELIIDDSFANYCFQRNEEDVFFWEEYIRKHPDRKEIIEEAVRMVLGLHAMLKRENDPVNEKQSSVLKPILTPVNKPPLKRILLYASVAAATLLLVVGIRNYWLQNKVISDPLKNIATNVKTNDELVYTTSKGEKKTFLLPDSTKICLGAGSTLRVEKNFGSGNRAVFLSGEALFDVTHNENLPFVVHSNKYDVKVLGTVFNVKAYPEDNISETSLIKGKVEISFRNNSQKIMLKPNQKAVINNKDESMVLENKKNSAEQTDEKISIFPLSYSSEDSVVIETAWAQNRLEIVNESFDEIKNKIERWYNVKIILADEEVGRYTFTATFTRETIDQVLKALQYSYQFTYKTEGKIITISK